MGKTIDKDKLLNLLKRLEVRSEERRIEFLSLNDAKLYEWWSGRKEGYTHIIMKLEDGDLDE